MMVPRFLFALCVALVPFGVAASPSPADLLPGIFSNEEQVQAARANGTTLPPWTGLRIAAVAGGFRVEPIDAFGTATAVAETWRVRETADRARITAGDCVRDFARVPAGLTIINRRGACRRPGLTTATDRGLALADADGSVLELQRARDFACTQTPSGGATATLLLHDAGGRAVVGVPSQRLVVSLRHIAWPLGDGLPALKLAIMAQGSKAPLAMATTDATATRIGLAMSGLDVTCSLAPSPKKPG